MKKYIRYVLVALAIIVFGILYSCERHNNDVEVIDAYEYMETTDSISSPSEGITDETVKSIYVHIAGCVASPGVYQLPEGSRVYEVVVLAGGFKEEADRDYINQAALLSDGQRLYIYSIEEAATAVENSNEDVSQDETSLVNINTASKEKLMTLPGVGESRAESIIAYREENGGFKAVEDIMKVSGIKDASFNKLKKYICVD